jgi:hypothetical protein
MNELFEVFMVVLFGLSWPLSISKSYKSRTTKGKSLWFELLIWAGYIFGILSKIVGGAISYVLVFYCINFVAVSIDLLLYLRNARIDAQESASAEGGKT